MDSWQISSLLTSWTFRRMSIPSWTIAHGSAVCRLWRYPVRKNGRCWKYFNITKKLLFLTFRISKSLRNHERFWAGRCHSTPQKVISCRITNSRDFMATSRTRETPLKRRVVYDYCFLRHLHYYWYKATNVSRRPDGFLYLTAFGRWASRGQIARRSSASRPSHQFSFGFLICCRPTNRRQSFFTSSQTTNTAYKLVALHHFFHRAICNIFSWCSTLFEKSNFCPKIQFWQNPNIFTSFSPKFFWQFFSWNQSC